jgi:hypothetical protein
MAITPAAQGEVWMVRILAKLENQDHINVLHFRCETAVDDINERLLVAIINCFLQNLVPAMSTQFVMRGATAHRIAPTLGPEIEYYPQGTLSVPLTGAASGDGLPSYSSVVTSIHTTRGGRSGRGRFYLGGIPEGSTTFSTITDNSAFWLAVLAFVACVAGQFIHTGDPGTNEISIGVWSRKPSDPNVPTSAPLGFAPATVLVPHKELATTRSRKVGHGS